MCAEEAEIESISQADRAKINHAATSLSRLLQEPSSPSSESAAVTSALDALKSLRTQLIIAYETRKHYDQARGRYEHIVSSTNAGQQRIEQDIIETKLRSGELLTIRDKVAHDLALAKKELQNANALIEADVSAPGTTSLRSDPKTTTNAASNSRTSQGKTLAEESTARSSQMPSETNDPFEGVESDELKQIVEEEMQKLKIAEQDLLQLMDESGVIKKRREELQRKMRIAQEE